MRRRGGRTSGERGQSSVELALVLPLALLLVLVVVQAGLLVRDQVLVVHAAREAARAAAVGEDDAQVRAAADGAGPLDADRLRVDISGSTQSGAPVQVVVRYRSVTDVPLVGVLLPDVELTARASMRRE